MQIKTIIRYHYISILEWLNLKRLAISSVGVDVEQVEFPMYIAGGGVKYYHHFRKGKFGNNLIISQTDTGASLVF